MSTVYVDVPSLLRLAESLPGDPQVDDLGSLFAAVARHKAVAMEREVYGSVWLQAASLLHTLARLPSLEAGNRAFAWTTAQAFLAVNGHDLDYKAPAAVALVLDVASGSMGVQQIAVRLRAWAVS